MNNIVFVFAIWLTEFLHSLAMFYTFICLELRARSIKWCQVTSSLLW